MSQYQRLISYLYRYENGVKKENTGYARIELRGEHCRVTVQLQDNMQNAALQTLPEVFLFIQKEWGMERIAAGQMRGNGNGYSCRIETRADNMMESGKSFAAWDGLLLYLDDDLFYATTWKDISVLLGSQESEMELAVAETDEMLAETEKAMIKEDEMLAETEKAMIKEDEMPEATEKAVIKADEMLVEAEKAVTEVERIMTETEKTAAGAEKIKATAKETIARTAEKADVEIQNEKDSPEAKKDASERKREITAQNQETGCQHCDCQHCPQKERNMDFGTRILSIFPKMYPFQIENMGECVRMELKDVGHLPVEHWALAGNPFLLHGYYCYRHIVFTRFSDRRCYIGVPGIFSKENQKKAEECGFARFQSLSEVKDLYGAFGYWLYPLEDNQSAR